MVRNEILIFKLYKYDYKLVSTRDDGSYYIGVWRRLQRACVYAWPCQGFRFSHKQSMLVEEDSTEQLLDI